MIIPVSRLFNVLIVTSVLFLGTNALGVILLDGNDSGNGINTTAMLNDGASIDGTPAIPQSSFSQEFAISANGGGQNGTHTGTIAFSDIPVDDLGAAGLFFHFIYDSQETGGNPPVSLDDVIISVAGTEYWNYDDATFGSIILNDPTANDETFSPLGNGSDMSLLVPVALFNGAGLIGSDILSFTWTQSDGHNGADEWVTVGDGFFDPNEPINDPPDRPDGGNGAIPEPITAALGLMGLGVLSMATRRRVA